ncbi:MAG: thioesterase family protein [Propionibacteriaceae bacterium]|nr:thioesterase family protein [Propionibacteriaceae bacterium]
MFRIPGQPDAYYRRLDEITFVPTLHTQGAWREDEQHMAPVGGLLAHCIEVHDPRPDLQLSRISYDILGMIPLQPTVVEVRTLRPGRSIELVEAVATIEGRPRVSARAWRLAEFASEEVAGHEIEPMPAPVDVPVWEVEDLWGGGYIDGVEFRSAPDRRPGRSRTWLRTGVPLVLDEVSTPTAHFLRLADTANGVATRLAPSEWAFPNVDMTIHLHREPVPGWMGLDTHVTIGPRGHGLTSATIHDEHGPVGTIQQMLTVRPARQPS